MLKEALELLMTIESGIKVKSDVALRRHGALLQVDISVKLKNPKSRNYGFYYVSKLFTYEETNGIIDDSIITHEFITESNADIELAYKQFIEESQNG